MEEVIITSLARQFGASIDMLENAISACPTAHWDTDRRFWHNAYHCLFFLDYYLTMEPANFAPPPPFDCSEFEDRMPERTYTKNELRSYLAFNREKYNGLIDHLKGGKLYDNWSNESGSMNYPVIEILLYNMRHVQHHAAQLNLLLRQTINSAPEWVSRANEEN